MTWMYKGEELSEVPEDSIGFIYKLTFSNGDYYIGQKGFFSISRKKIPGKRNRKVVTKESNWKTYNSSSKDVKERIKAESPTTREILYLCKNKSTMNYMEAYEMFKHWVLTDPKALNKNILLKLFHNPEGNYT